MLHPYTFYELPIKFVLHIFYWKSLPSIFAPCFRTYPHPSLFFSLLFFAFLRLFDELLLSPLGALFSAYNQTCNCLLNRFTYIIDRFHTPRCRTWFPTHVHIGRCLMFILASKTHFPNPMCANEYGTGQSCVAAFTVTGT